MSNSTPINIIISGYPKSGTTWLTKLVAGILDCPAAGFWGVEGDNLSIEGTKKVSPFRCYKAHQLYPELSEYSMNYSSVIYVVRDPRDIVVSGAHHYTFLPSWLRTLLRITIRSSETRHKIFYKLTSLVSIEKRKNEMLAQVIGESKSPSKWLRHSWSQHVASYQDQSGVLVLRYEDLLDDPLAQCKQIAHWLDHTIDDDQLESIIKQNSFDQKKSQHLQHGDYFNHRHMRKGIANQWKEELKQGQIDNIQTACQDSMVEYHYL